MDVLFRRWKSDFALLVNHVLPSKFVIERGCLFTENSNRPHGHGPIDPRLFSPYPKNPIIARVFKEVGWADELGSGVRKLFKYGRSYAGHDPELLEDDIFRVNLALSEEAEGAVAPGLVDGLVDGLADGLAESQRAIIKLVRNNPRISKREMAEQIGISSTAIDKNIESLKQKGLLSRVGPKKSGHWEVVP